MIDFNTMVGKLGDAIARDDMRNAVKIVEAVDRYRPADMITSTRLPEYNDYCAYVQRETSPRRTR